MSTPPDQQNRHRITFFRRCFWHFIYAICIVYGRLFYRYRARLAQPVARNRPVLILANHQSYLDPILVGMAIHPTVGYSMARRSLWNNPVLARIITWLNAIAVERGEMDMAAIRRCLGILQEGYPLVLYPEGTRTSDGSVGPFASGTMLLIRRAKPQVIPVGIAGAFEVWPRDRSKPHATGCIRICVGEPIEADQLLSQPASEALDQLHQAVCELQAQAAQWRTS